MCLAWMMPNEGGKVRQWRPGQPISRMRTLFEWIKAGGIVEAHNSFFERCIWENVFAPQYGAPEIDPKQWRCSAAKAAAYGLPRDLAGACSALLELDLKDMAGRKVMLKLCKPRRARKGEHCSEIYYFEGTTEERQTLWAYNAQDVRAEHALSSNLPDLSPFELEVWRATEAANWRGVQVDADLCRAAIRIDRDLKKELNRELYMLTGIRATTCRAQLLQWLIDNGADISSTKAETLDALMARDDLRPEVMRVVEIARIANRTSVKKFTRILEMMDPIDGRVRELCLYHGATTGRWAGKGIQVQNFPRGAILSRLKIDIEEAVADVKRGLAHCRAKYGGMGEVLELLSAVTRGALIASEGMEFLSADYSAIEARCVMWLAGEENGLEVFRAGRDIYCEMASVIYRRPINKKEHPVERQFGKTAILALGYGMGFITFALRLRLDMQFTVAQVIEIMGQDAYAEHLAAIRAFFMPDYNAYAAKGKQKEWHAAKRVANEAKKKIAAMARTTWPMIKHELALCRYVVAAFRGEYPKVADFWHQMERQLYEVMKDGVARNVGEWLTWVYDAEQDVAKCILPSGRALIYRKPKVVEIDTQWGPKPQFRFWGVAKTGAKKYTETGTYGAALVENATQGFARDIMARAFVASHRKRDQHPVMTVHDELLAEGPKGRGTVESFEALLVRGAAGFPGCPITAEGAIFGRYQK